MRPDKCLIRALVRNENFRTEVFMTDLIKQITGDLQKQIDGFEPELNISDIGTVTEAGDGIARVHGLANVRAQELVQFANGVMGTAFNLEKDSVGVIVMGDYGGIIEGMSVRGTGRISSVPVGDAMIGRVVNALGEPIDGKGPIATTGADASRRTRTVRAAMSNAAIVKRAACRVRAPPGSAPWRCVAGPRARRDRRRRRGPCRGRSRARPPTGPCAPAHRVAMARRTGSARTPLPAIEPCDAGQKARSR